jgi:hypothetical protein
MAFTFLGKTSGETNILSIFNSLPYIRFCPQRFLLFRFRQSIVTYSLSVVILYLVLVILNLVGFKMQCMLIFKFFHCLKKKTFNWHFYLIWCVFQWKTLHILEKVSVDMKISLFWYGIEQKMEKLDYTVVLST